MPTTNPFSYAATSSPTTHPVCNNGNFNNNMASFDDHDQKRRSDSADLMEAERSSKRFRANSSESVTSTGTTITTTTTTAGMAASSSPVKLQGPFPGSTFHHHHHHGMSPFRNAFVEQLD